MKKLILAVSLSLLSLSLLACAGRKDLTVLYWNIQNGMWSDQADGYDNFVSFVKGIDPDICIWCEAESRYITGTDKKMKMPEEQYLPWNWDLLAARYGHQYTLVCGKRDGFPQVITSKYPLRIVKRLTGNGDDVIVVHGAGWAKVDLGKGRELNLVTLHTYPFKYAYRAADKEASAAAREGDFFRAVEMKYICEQTIAGEPDAARQYWLMAGDFNAISSADNYHYNRDLSDPAFLVHDYIRNNTPYIDVIEDMHKGEFRKSTQSGRRIDMVYVTPALRERVVEADYIHDGFPTSVRDSVYRKFCHPSDHYPAIVRLKL